MSGILGRHWQTALRPKDRRPIYEWARGMKLPAVLTRSDFDPDISRHFKAPLDALQDDHVRQVVVRKPVRGGGTLISDLWHVWCRANEPGPAMCVLQTDQIADEHAESRLMPMMLQCPEIADKLPTDRHKIRGSSIIFADGIPFYVRGPGISKLQTKGLRYISLDEVWLYKPGTVAEAEGRLKDYVRLQNEKLLLISQGGDEGDDFDRKFIEGEAWEWNVACLGCGQKFPPRWTWELPDGRKAGMRWDENKLSTGMWDVPKCAATCRYECPHCGHPHFDTARTKQEWNRLGDYARNTSENRHKKSYHWNAIISDPWQIMVSEFLEAVNLLRMGLPEKIIQFFQKSMAEPRSEATVNEGTVDFRKMAYDVATSDPDDVMVVMTVDRQEEDLFYVMVRVWKKNGSSRRLWVGKCYSRADLKAKADEWKATNVLIDSGYQPKGDHGVYAICTQFHSGEQRWIATKGAEESRFWHEVGPMKQRRKVQRSYAPPADGDPESGIGVARRTAVLVRFSSTTMADRVNGLIKSGMWVEPVVDPNDETERDYRKQMSAEFKKQKLNKFTGKVEWVYVCPSRHNHYFDCAKQQVLAATIAGVIPDLEVDTVPTDNGGTTDSA